MKIAIAEFSGIDCNVTSLKTTALGGAHSAAIYLALAMARLGQEVFFLSTTSSPGIYDGVTCLSFDRLTPQAVRGLGLDVLICVMSKPDIGQQWRQILGPRVQIIYWNHHAHTQPGLEGLAAAENKAPINAFVMVSQWQQQQYIRQFGLEPGRTMVLRNAIAPTFQGMFPGGILAEKSRPPVLVYTSTPFRGLDLLVEAFPAIAAQVPGARLQVYSSMNLYGKTAGEDDRKYGALYERCRRTEGVEYIGSVPQSRLATVLRSATLLAYPNTFEETSCIAAMEAMAAGCQIVTSAMAALPETTAGFARLIPVPQKRPDYLRLFTEQCVIALRESLEAAPATEQRLRRQVDWINSDATWDHRARQWVEWLGSLIPPAPAPAGLNIDQAMALGLRFHQAGHLPEAESIYRRVLAHHADHPDALHLLGLIAFNAGTFDTALQLINRAIQIRPDAAEYYSNLAAVLEAMKRPDESLAAAKRALDLRPDSAVAWYNYGNTLRHKGEFDAAIDAYHRSLELDPGGDLARSNLGATLNDKGLYSQAIAEYQILLARRSDWPLLYNNLGESLRNNGQIDEAMEAARKAIALDPNYATAYNNLGASLAKKERHDEAFEAFSRALSLDPDMVEARGNLANSYHQKGDLDRAITELRQALRQRPDYAAGWSNLGNILKEKGLTADSIAACRKAIQIRPNYPEAFYNLGNALADDSQQDAAIEAFDEAMRLRPAYTRPLNNKAGILKEQGRLADAMECYDRFLSAEPDHTGVHSNRLYVQLFFPGADPAELVRQHRQWDQLHGQPLKASIRPHANDRSPERPLRIGYVSPDFRLHSVAFFLLPLFEAHDHGVAHITAYSTSNGQDDFTSSFKSCADQWRNITAMEDETAAELIRADAIDILIDLSGHTSRNRLLLFARKPAPIQATYLGYPFTTGMETMDWRITDAIADPPGAEQYYSEKLLRLPDIAWCFKPLSGIPPIEIPNRREIVFGSFNDLAKVNPPLLALWARILQRVPHSRLLFKNRASASPSVKKRLRDGLQAHGIDPQRVEVLPPILSSHDHLRCYGLIDIALDTFPYHGTTTTCEAMWMGVPVVSLAGKIHVNRVGVSLLTSVGLPELVATDEDDYVRIAANLAQDSDRRRQIRSSLRQKMQESSLMNGPRLARNIEAGYRRMWRDWLETR